MALTDCCFGTNLPAVLGKVRQADGWGREDQQRRRVEYKDGREYLRRSQKVEWIICKKDKKNGQRNGPDSVNTSLYRPVSSADQHVIGVIRWEPPFISVSSSWAHDTSRRLDSDHWRPRVTPLMPAITAPHTTTTIFSYTTTSYPSLSPTAHQP